MCVDDPDITRRFLLGAVTDDECEQLQDRFFTDDSLFDDMLLMEDQLTDEYLFAVLSAEDLARFESYFLVAPQRREKLRVAQALREYTVQRKLGRLPYIRA